MIERPTADWQRSVAADKPHAAELWPAGFTAAVDKVLDAYEREVAAIDVTDDNAVWAAVERVVVGLNAADEPYEAIETDEREQLAEYVDAVLSAAGVDVEALTSRRDLHRSELTDTWREW